jgi:hypothetical protein
MGVCEIARTARSRAMAAVVIVISSPRTRKPNIIREISLPNMSMTLRKCDTSGRASTLVLQMVQASTRNV